VRAPRGAWRPVRDMDPEFWRKLGAELSSVRPWIDRGIVLAYAALTGLIVVGFTLLAEAATHGFAALTQASVYAKYISLLWTPALTVVLLWWTRRFVPGAMGSGIPQVVRALDDNLDHAQRSWLVSLRLSLHKIGWSGRPAGRLSVAARPAVRSVQVSWGMPGAGCRRNRSGLT
jgi:H+/Cl- antiporter ClcA